jgi:hypothetical protein
MESPVKRPKVAEWRAPDQHTGIGKADGMPYTYEHLGQTPRPRAQVYRVEGYVAFPRIPIHCNVYYVAGRRLDEFFNQWGEHHEIVVDVRPMTWADAEREIEAFRRRNRRRT